MSRKSTVITLVLAVLVGVGIVAGVLLSKPAAQLDRSTPQGVVQGYLEAALGRDYNAALTYLDPAAGCKISAFDNAYIPDNASVSLGRVTVTAASASVEVKVTYASSDILGTGGNEAHVYRLTRVAGVWRISGAPWPLYDCGTVK